jgi:predicted signal transduction protein with EAL and GGDEF domain
LAIGVACFPENGADAASLMAFAELALAGAKEARRASRNVMVQLEHSIRRPA